MYIMHPVPYCRTDINLRQLSFLKMFLVSFAPELVGYSAPRDLHRRAAYSICVSLFLIHQDVYHDLFVCS